MPASYKEAEKQAKNRNKEDENLDSKKSELNDEALESVSGGLTFGL